MAEGFIDPDDLFVLGCSAGGLQTSMGQSEEFFRALKMQGKETLLIRMPEEFHGWRRPSHRILNQLYLQARFEKYRTSAPGS